MRSGDESAPAPAVVTPGNHDGVHLGHRALVSAAREVARESASPLRVVALTFDPHPLHFIASDEPPPLLTSVARRIELLREAGADEVFVQRFDLPFSQLTPDGFVEEILVAKLGVRAVVVGRDFRFGAKRAGDVALLRQLGARHGFEVTTVAPVTLDGERVSSSHVRTALMQGDVERAARMLTRVHELERRVVRGHQRGRTIGFPTANLELSGPADEGEAPGLLTPADGVYAVRARVLDAAGRGLPEGQLSGVANVGERPTVQGGRSMEVHLFDFDGDLYGRTLRVGFVKRLRGEQRFADLPALRSQIARDADSAREALRACDPRLLAWI